MNRTKNAARNILFGVSLRIYQVLVPFLMRTAMIYLMGVEYLGLNSLFTSILQALNLAELGVGSAMIYSMYKPIADNDEKTICALLRLYKRYYFVIGAVIAGIGVCLTPLIPKLISGEIPGNLNVYVLYLLNLAATVMTYWLFAYKNSLLQANQRSDIASKVTLATTTIQYGIQMFVLWAFHNYYYYVIVMLAAHAVTNIVTAVVTSKMYPNYAPKGDLPRDQTASINQRIKDLFTAKLGATIVNSADTIVISAFLGLTMLAMYQNYYFIMNAVMSLIAIIFSSCLAGVGNSMVTESLDKNYEDFMVITFLINWIVTTCTCCFATMYQPFIELWVGEKYQFNYGVVILFCIYFYLVTMQQVIGVYKDAAGMWHQDRYRPLVASILNLVLNISLVKIWGIYAILASTIISYLAVAIPWLIINVFNCVFKRDAKKYVTYILGDFCICAVTVSVCIVVCNIWQISGALVGVIKGFSVSIILSNLILFFCLRKSQYLSRSFGLIERISKGKIRISIGDR